MYVYNVASPIPTWAASSRNLDGETAIHCAAYNSLDSGDLMDYLLGVCRDNSTLDIEDVLSLHEYKAKVS